MGAPPPAPAAFGVARLVAHGDAAEIGAAELAFTSDELTALAQAVLGREDAAALAAVQRVVDV